MLVLDNLQFTLDSETKTITISEEGHNFLHMPLDDIDELVNWLNQARRTISGDTYY